jgi:hypothetical protein
LQTGLLGPSQRYTALNHIGAGPGGITAAQLPANTGDGITYVGNAQVVPTASPVGGAILYASGGVLWVYQSNGGNFPIVAGTGAMPVVWTDDLAGSSNAAQYVSGLSGGPNGGAVTLGASAWIAVANNATQAIVKAGASTFLLAADGANNLVLNGISNVQVQAGGVPLAKFDGLLPGLSFSPNLTGPVVLGWKGLSTAAVNGAGLTLVPQASTNVNASPGWLTINLGAAAGTGSEAYVSVQRNGTAQLQLGTLVGSSGNVGAIYAGLAPASSNFSLGITTTNTIVNAPSAAGSVYLGLGGALQVQLNPTALQCSLPVSGLGGPLRWGIGTLNVTGIGFGPTTLPVSVYQNPIIKFTSTASPGAAQIVFPNVEAEWIIDLSGMAFGPGSMNFQAGSATKVVVVSHTSPLFMRLLCDGNSNLYQLIYS